jgi:hypothetical protein
MARRSAYKRAVIQRGRAQHKAVKAQTADSRPPTPPTRPRQTNRPRNAIDWLGRKRRMVIMTVASLLVAIVGTGATFYFGLWSSSPAPVTGKPVPAVGSKSPPPNFNGRSTIRMHGTLRILYSLDNAVKFASPKGKTIVMLGPVKPTSYCGNSFAMPRTGVYRCVIHNNGIDTIADPCFGVDKHQVECEIPNGSIGLVGVINIVHPKRYRPYLPAHSRPYPFRLVLDNGMTCTWNWLPFRSHQGGGWICSRPQAAIELHPVRGHRFLSGRAALNYNGALITGTKLMYYAEHLTSGNRNTWSVLLEGPSTPGVFQPVRVTQAWF